MSFSQTTDTGISETIIALEKAALEKWNQGDPGGYLNLSADDVTYFDPYTDHRLDGLEALKIYYEPVKGQIHVSRYEMLNPKVTATNTMAVLTFNLHSYAGDNVSKWNCTEVYRLEPNGQWKIVQTHWSFIKPLSQ
ncbi:MAG: nuclear transport factor 2 family protein [Cyclobacteriaceae bacterium]|nr:nuclear transport factor 2 family protein [Cyclobacteriaceae bacterium]